MARTRSTAEEIIGHLRTIEIETGKGLGIAEACRKLGITEQNSGMSCRTANSSTRGTRRKCWSNAGAATTIRTVRTVRWGIGHPPQKHGGSHPSGCRRDRTSVVA